MKTKVITYILPLLGLLTPMFLTSCTDTDEDIPSANSQSARPHVRVILRNATPQTRVTYEPDTTRINFEAGDLMGAFAVDSTGADSNDQPIYGPVTNDEIGITCNNLQYQVVGTDPLSQTLETVMSQDEMPYGESYRYIFYYPFREGISFRNVTHAVETDQSVERYYELSDLMWSRTPAVGSAQNPLVFAEMRHAMANILLNIDASELSGEHKASVLQIPYIATGIDLTALGEEYLKYSVDTPTADIAMWCVNNEATEGTLYFRAVVPAQTIKPGPFLQIVTPSGLKQYTLTEELTMRPGKNYTFNVAKRSTTNAPTRALSASGNTDNRTIILQPVD